jgi:hypothetical protein
VVPKKAGITMIKNKDNELVPTLAQLGWRVCINYKKLNSITRKENFHVPSLIKWWRDWLAMITIVSWMATPVITKFRWILKTKRRLLSLALSVRLPIVVCHLGCVIDSGIDHV